MAIPQIGLADDTKGVSTGGSSMGYSVTKAAGLHLMRCLAATQGPKIRFNAVLPGLLLTEWGLRYSEERVNALKDKAVLKDVVCMLITIANHSNKYID